MKTRHIIITAVIVALVGLGVLAVGGRWLWRRGHRFGLAPGAEGKGVLLVSRPGERYVGGQLRFFSVDADGVIGATNIAFLNLYHTEGRSFRLTGQLWPGETGEKTPHPDLPDGFALFIREWDSLHRYSLRTRSLEVKRRLHGGHAESGVVHPVSFVPPGRGSWLPFAADVSAAGISFQVGGQSGEIKGPLDTDGVNRIALVPGARLKDLRVEIRDSPK